MEHEAQERKAAEAAAKEKVAQRQWILQYAEDDSESEPDEDDTEQVSQKCSPLQTWDTLKQKCTYTTEYRFVQYLTSHSVQVLCRNSHLHTLQYRKICSCVFSLPPCCCANIAQVTVVAENYLENYMAT